MCYLNGADCGDWSTNTNSQYSLFFKVGMWLPEKLCPSPSGRVTTHFSAADFFQSQEEAQVACEAGCEAHAECAYASLYFNEITKQATCYLSDDDCGDFTGSTHSRYTLYIKPCNGCS